MRFAARCKTFEQVTRKLEKIDVYRRERRARHSVRGRWSYYLVSIMLCRAALLLRANPDGMARS